MPPFVCVMIQPLKHYSSRQRQNQGIHSYLEATVTSGVRFELGTFSLIDQIKGNRAMMEETVKAPCWVIIQTNAESFHLYHTAVTEAAFCSRNSSVSQVDQHQLHLTPRILQATGNQHFKA